MARPIAFDLARLFYGGVAATPRGIDRVDMSLARRLFDDPARQDCGVVPTQARMGVMRPAEARALATRVEQRWGETRPAQDDGAYADLRAWLDGRTTHPPAPGPVRATRPGWAALAWHGLAMLHEARRAPLRAAARTVPRGAVYLNTGQVLLGSPWPLGWLDRRRDVRTALLLHDVIPVDFPEYAGLFLARRHARAIETAARYATAMLATSEASADDIRRELRRFGRGDMPFHVVPLPVSASLIGDPASPPAPGAVPYFVAVSVLDQRKNHRLLLHLWRDLVRHAEGPVPKLVIVGSRGLRTQGLLDLVARSPGLGDAVRIVSGLSSPAMREVIGGARALLAPSWAEGFGLPIVEALALRVPVIASAIPAHREVGGATTAYLDPLDGLAWRDAVLERAAESPRAAAERRARLGGGTPQTWASYVDAILPFLETL